MLFEDKIIEALTSIAPDFMYILADQNGVEEAAPYVLVSVMNPRMMGPSNNINKSDTGQYVQQDLSITFRLTLHATSNDPAQDQYERMWIGLKSNVYGYEFLQQGLGIYNVADIIYTPAPVDAVTYKRATFDLTCYTNRIEEFAVPAFNRVEVEGTLTDESGQDVSVDIVVNRP